MTSAKIVANDKNSYAIKKYNYQNIISFGYVDDH